MIRTLSCLALSGVLFFVVFFVLFVYCFYVVMISMVPVQWVLAALERDLWCLLELFLGLKAKLLRKASTSLRSIKGNDHKQWSEHAFSLFCCPRRAFPPGSISCWPGPYIPPSCRPKADRSTWCLWLGVAFWGVLLKVIFYFHPFLGAF